MKSAQVPSILAEGSRPSSSQTGCAPAELGEKPRTLTDLLHPGFYMVFLLRNGHVPAEGSTFREQVRRLLSEVEHHAHELQLPSDHAAEALFAFCALIDEVILESKLSIRSDWECSPLQLEMFGEHMAGERFFDKLEILRRHSAVHLSVLEVFHMCLLLGFKGRYVLEGKEKLDYLTARLGDEISHLQDRRAAFAPHWAVPDNVVHRLRGDTPLWVTLLLFVALTLVAFITLRLKLQDASEQDLARYSDIVQLAPRSAHVTITLP
ncbi:type IVB secretion system protein IcmH/DotU [Azohydromonas caseinilytica]|uniref:DotU family type IV/VI secretion system protein n=1 Tax=Azohydromonas caseinilytica TaxID=2728836 RepID=A0A848FIC4_9BURK|nr:type IVB secretion system protein IcmH/DotU [Azohydromonas caseinilytica]NML19034.1 DotU family type IV/VI secretion system protein [Azohydromonas caseinilytica]